MHLNKLRRIKRVQELYKQEQKHAPTAKKFLQLLAVEHNIYICRATLYNYLSEAQLNRRITAAEITAAKELKAAKEIRAVKRKLKK